jgi:4-amino-4-deoxy-L-arabinose transferase-like glycosyltransferase
MEYRARQRDLCAMPNDRKNFIMKYFKYLILAALVYVPIFVHLDHVPIRIWDESRTAINAYEMLKNGNYIVTHYEGKPDMWNTKPPLLIWFQVFFMKHLGVNELSVRLPSAIAAFLTCLVILFFSIWYLKQFWFGFIAVMVLITTYGYIDFHATRTGDYDSLLTLFTTLSGLFFFIFIETKKNRYLYLFFLATILAVLTKSIAGLLFLPALIIYSLWQRQFSSFIDNKHFYIGLISFLFIVLGYYLLRELNNPGYIAIVQKGELGGRFLSSLHTPHEFSFYFKNLVNYRLTIWCVFIPCGIFLGLINKDPKINKIALLSSLMALSHLLIISIGKTKLDWYDVPEYPFFSILIAIPIFYIFALLNNFEWNNQKLFKKIIPFIFLFLILLSPYIRILDKTYLPQVHPWEKDFYEIGYFLKDAIKGTQDVDGYYLAFYEVDGNNAHNLFYLNILNDKGVTISFKDWKILDKGDKVIAHQKEVKEYIIMNYTHDIINVAGNVTKFKIYDRKQ